MAYTHKTVDGIQVPLSAEEIAELEARDAATAIERAAPQPTHVLADLIGLLRVKNVITAQEATALVAKVRS